MPFYAGQKLRASNLGQLSTTAQYQNASTQSIPDSTDTVIAFGTDQFTSSLITKSTQGAGHKFTFGTNGIVSVTTTIQFAANATGERAIHFEDSLGLWHGSVNNHGDSGNPTILNLGITKYFASGDWIVVEAYQTSGGALNVDSNALLALGRIDLAYILVES